MTAIAYRDGVMAADRGVWAGTSLVGLTTKICRLADGRLVGMSGQHGYAVWWRKWLEDGADPAAYRAPDQDEGMSALIIGTDGSVTRFQKGYFCDEVTAAWQFIGAVPEFLHGAMAAGASAERAVELAIEHTDGAAGGVDVLRVLKGWEPWLETQPCDTEGGP